MAPSNSKGRSWSDYMAIGYAQVDAKPAPYGRERSSYERDYLAGIRAQIERSFDRASRNRSVPA